MNPGQTHLSHSCAQVEANEYSPYIQYVHWSQRWLGPLIDSFNRLFNRQTNELLPMNGPLEPDADGDVVLNVYGPDTTTSFRVSSKVLKLASPVFVRMLSPSFKEGQELLQADRVEIDLEDDDAPSMSLILDVLHYKADREFHILDAEALALLAIHCDKYDCARALGPWISTWFDKMVRSSQSGVDLGYQLLAAYMFNDANKFLEISKAALEEMTPDLPTKWLQEDTLTLLPTSISGRLSKKICQEHL
jgi:hypothetical protein